MSLSTNFPNVRPSLLLDFAGSRKLDPRITFARAATAVYYDGVTTAKAEENLILNSENVTGSGWTVFGMTATANTTTAPDGNSTAGTITNTAVTDYHTLIASAAPVGVASTTVTISCFIKKGTVRYVGLALYNAVTLHSGAGFDLDLGTVTGTGGAGAGFSASGATITSVGNGWYRCSVVCVNGSASPAATARVVHRATSYSSGAVVENYAGTTSDTTYVWGMQVEQRSTVTAYTPTTTQAITNYIPKLQTAAADVARFDNNPITGESLGLLIEEGRTNLFTYSEQFDNAAWSKSRSVVTANAAVAPDGTVSADKLIDDTTASNTHYVVQSFSATNGTTYTCTVYAKAGERSQVAIFAFNTNSVFATSVAIFNLTTGLNTRKDAAFASTSITPVGNGWYRVSASIAAAATATGNIGIAVTDSDSTVNSTGNGYSGIYIWGAQLEAGTFATSYIPTVASQVTRAADAASMTGTNFSSWYRADEGTLYTEAKALAAVVSQTFASIDDGSNNNAIYLITSPSNSGFDRYQVNVGGTAQASLGSSGFVATNTNKMSGAYKVNDFSRAINGGAALTDTSGTVPVVNALRIGNQASANFVNGTIKKLAYYPARLTNAQLQALTLS